jgi:hypothetical protein
VDCSLNGELEDLFSFVLVCCVYSIFLWLRSDENRTLNLVTDPWMYAKYPVRRIEKYQAYPYGPRARVGGFILFCFGLLCL